MDAVSSPIAPRPLRTLAGPPGLPLVGNAFQVRVDRFHQQLEGWAARYGDRFRFSIGARQFLAIRNPEVVASVLRQRPEAFRKSRRLEQVTRELGFHGVFSANGEAWRRQRPVVLAGLDPAHIRTFLPAIVEVTDTLRRRWEAAARAGQPIDLLADLMRYTVDVTTTLAFGRNLHTLESDDADAIQRHLNHILPALFRRALAPVNLARWFDRATAAHVRALRQAVDQFVADARRQLADDAGLQTRPANLIQALVAANAQGEARMSDDEVGGNVLTMLLAGEDTTANTLAWLLWLLRANPAPLQEAQREADRVVGRGGQVRAPEQLAALDFVEACANEAMRLKPVAPLNVVEAAEDTVVDGVLVPKGALVACIMRPGGIDPRHFPDPQRFDPGRWLGEAAQARGLSSAKRIVMPFGAGPRICPGRYLALAEIKMVTAMLLARFELAEVGTETGGEPEEHMSLVMSPVGLRMRLRPRGPQTAD